MGLDSFDGNSARMRLLALHGRGSNSDITRMQLHNLGVQGENYEVVYLDGPILVDKPGPGVEASESGPWYSWFPNTEMGEENGEELLNATCNAVYSVLEAIEKEGPFDAIYGFSQGAVVANLVNELHQDRALQNTLILQHGENAHIRIPEHPIFRTAVFACSAAPLSVSQLRRLAGLDPVETPSEYNSLHLIGRKDRFKPYSEAFACSTWPSKTRIIYLPDGHEINLLTENGRNISDQVRNCLIGNAFDPHENDVSVETTKWLKSSTLSHRAVESRVQIADVRLNLEGLPRTITGMLACQPHDAPLFRNAREQNASVFCSYGEMLAFCQEGGEGDLRRIGVKSGEVVAYIAPPGGNAVSACAFLSIASQTCAAPLSPALGEADALLALQQLNVKHLVVFEGVSAPGVEAAFATYSLESGARLHQADDTDMPSPGLFRYCSPVRDFASLPALTHVAAANSLLLRTSGTTSVPKVVPLKQKDLVTNSLILADSIGIHAEDVTYSVMPLDHIGGISASILCSVAVGASITCDGIYNPHSMVEALSLSNPRPTWYSAVPTIHNGTVRYLQDNADQYLDRAGKWQGHNLRFIRSGAAALKEPDRLKLQSTFGCPVIATYSMSEQMPISQPPVQGDAWLMQPGSVGVPLTASLAIVDPVSLQPLPFGEEGEVAISGETVFSGYQNNDDANNGSRFLMRALQDGVFRTGFLTGDLGQMDRDGTLTLKGRIKELIKRGGEQVAPAEVETLLVAHAGVDLAVCFSVPSDVYGEEVGCALVLKSSYANGQDIQNVVREMRALLRDSGLAPYKVPSCWKLAVNEDIPRTGSKKIMRNKLADELQVTPGVSVTQRFTAANSPAGDEKHEQPARRGTGESQVRPPSPVPVAASLSDKPHVDWSTLAGFRFLLACYVMFMHIGSNDSWDAFSNLRQFPWHVHTFFTLAGFTLAVIMPSLIKQKMAFISARVWGMYPLYGLAVLLVLANLLTTCQPSTFSSAFHWAQIVDSGKMFCEGTPLVQDSWIANVFLTLGIHLTGLQATPLWGASWFMGFYLWFISMYFQCLVVFPFLYNALYKHRGNTKRLFSLTVLGLGANVLIVLAFWYGYAVDATGYGFFDALTGLRATPSEEQLEMAGKDNAVILGFYLFAPFWVVYFIAGMCAAFLYDAIRPAEQLRAEVWGKVADAITVLMIAVSIAHITQGYFEHGDNMAWVSTEQNALRPAAADSLTDPATVNRIWDNIYGRLFAPITLLWIFALSTGKGVTARVLRSSPISQTLAPTAFACFLFHQVIGQWYYAATRNGDWWNWWSDQKDFYWFSPQPVPVEWYEYFYVVGLVVIFAKAIQPVDPLMRQAFGRIKVAIRGAKGVGEGEVVARSPEETMDRILDIVFRITGMEVQPEWTLEECGLASLGIVQLTSVLRTEFSMPSHKIQLSVTDLMSVKNIRDIVSLVESALQEEVTSGGSKPGKANQNAISST